jgi:D-sedoheptulose 7-phosphate isomerase
MDERHTKVEPGERVGAMPDPGHGLEKAAHALICGLKETLSSQGDAVGAAASLIEARLRAGGKLLICGNGGSAADSQHIAAEFVNRFRMDRRPLAAVALSTDTSILTACGNDYGFDLVFEKQVQALGRSGDILWAISTSGNSPNVIRALDAARSMGMATIGFSGSSGGRMKGRCDILIRVASSDTPRIQEIQIFLAHMICELVESALCMEDGSQDRQV